MQKKSRRQAGREGCTAELREEDKQVGKYVHYTEQSNKGRRKSDRKVRM
jgi:hypothetical protein